MDDKLNELYKQLKKKQLEWEAWGSVLNQVTASREKTWKEKEDIYASIAAAKEEMKNKKST